MPGVNLRTSPPEVGSSGFRPVSPASDNKANIISDFGGTMLKAFANMSETAKARQEAEDKASLSNFVVELTNAEIESMNTALTEDGFGAATPEEVLSMNKTGADLRKLVNMQRQRGNSRAGTHRLKSVVARYLSENPRLGPEAMAYFERVTGQSFGTMTRNFLADDEQQDIDDHIREMVDPDFARENKEKLFAEAYEITGRISFTEEEALAIVQEQRALDAERERARNNKEAGGFNAPAWFRKQAALLGEDPDQPLSILKEKVLEKQRFKTSVEDRKQEHDVYNIGRKETADQLNERVMTVEIPAMVDNLVPELRSFFSRDFTKLSKEQLETELAGVSQAVTAFKTKSQNLMEDIGDRSLLTPYFKIADDLAVFAERHLKGEDVTAAAKAKLDFFNAETKYQFNSRINPTGESNLELQLRAETAEKFSNIINEFLDPDVRRHLQDLQKLSLYSNSEGQNAYADMAERAFSKSEVLGTYRAINDLMSGIASGKTDISDSNLIQLFSSYYLNPFSQLSEMREEDRVAIMRMALRSTSDPQIVNALRKSPNAAAYQSQFEATTQQYVETLNTEINGALSQVVQENFFKQFNLLSPGVFPEELGKIDPSKYIDVEISPNGVVSFHSPLKAADLKELYKEALPQRYKKTAERLDESFYNDKIAELKQDLTTVNSRYSVDLMNLARTRLNFLEGKIETPKQAIAHLLKGGRVFGDLFPDFQNSQINIKLESVSDANSTN